MNNFLLRNDVKIQIIDGERICQNRPIILPRYDFKNNGLDWNMDVTHRKEYSPKVTRFPPA